MKCNRMKSNQDQQVRSDEISSSFGGQGEEKHNDLRHDVFSVEYRLLGLANH